MCWKCQEIDKQILHYRALGSRVTDGLTLQGIDLLVAKLEAGKKDCLYVATVAPDAPTGR